MKKRYCAALRKWLHLVELSNKTFNWTSAFGQHVITHRVYKINNIVLGFYYPDKGQFVFDNIGFNNYRWAQLINAGLFEIMEQRIYQNENKAKI